MIYILPLGRDMEEFQVVQCKTDIGNTGIGITFAVKDLAPSQYCPIFAHSCGYLGCARSLAQHSQVLLSACQGQEQLPEHHMPVTAAKVN